MITVLEIRALEKGYDPDQHKDNMTADEFLTYCVIMSKWQSGSIGKTANDAYSRAREYTTVHPAPYCELDYIKLATYPDISWRGTKR